MNKQSTFTCHSTPHLFEGHSDGIEYTLHAEKTLDEMLESFRNFLIASGYQFKLTETIQVVDEDWEDAQVEADDDDDLPSIKVANFQGGDTFWTNEGTTMGTGKGGTDAE